MSVRYKMNRKDSVALPNLTNLVIDIVAGVVRPSKLEMKNSNLQKQREDIYMFLKENSQASAGRLIACSSQLRCNLNNTRQIQIHNA